MTTHGYTKNRKIPKEFRAWQLMKDRCYNKNFRDYRYYGGKGIVVCERWRNSFVNFLEDMGYKPTDNHSLDRFPNLNGNYEPPNCRWATKQEQSRNRSYCKFFRYNGEMVHLEDLAKALSTYPSNINRMLRLKTIEQVISYYEQRNNLSSNSGGGRRIRITSNRAGSLMSQCRASNLNYHSVYYLMSKNGISIKEAINFFINKNKS